MIWKNKLVKAYKNFMETPEGKIVLADLLKFSGYNNPSYIEGKPDATAFNEGKKSYARRVLTLMNFSESDAKKMKEELKTNINKNKGLNVRR